MSPPIDSGTRNGSAAKTSSPSQAGRRRTSATSAARATTPAAAPAAAGAARPLTRSESRGVDEGLERHGGEHERGEHGPRTGTRRREDEGGAGGAGGAQRGGALDEGFDRQRWAGEGGATT